MGEQAFYIAILSSAVIAGTPILYAALGELVTERAGVTNLGVEGMMLIGAVSGFMAAIVSGTSEIGLLVALGAPRRTILGLFLGEAVTLSALGGIVGLALGFGLAQLIHLLVPALPVQTPISFVIYAELVAIIIGLLAGVLPARRAASLDPVEALRAE